MVDKKETLQSLYKEALLHVAFDKKHLLHLSTLKNYIRYFDKIQTQDQEKVFELLSNYTSLLSEGVNVKDIDDSLGLFQKFISPLIIYYETQVGFTAYVRIWLFLIWFFVAELITLLFTRNIVVLSIIGLLFCIYYTSILKKQKDGKVHGFQY